MKNNKYYKEKKRKRKEKSKEKPDKIKKFFF